MQFPEFPGHFPGDPLVPGAALLVAVDAQVRAQLGRGLAGIERARFVEPVRPGEEVEVRVRADGEQVRFGVLVDGRERARGVGRLTRTAASGGGLA